MSKSQCQNRVKEFRKDRKWSQAELAQRSGVSRTAVSAIEIGRLIPSVAAALALARTFACSVETLFGDQATEISGQWYDGSPSGKVRYWKSRVGGRDLLYPVEWTASGLVGHDGFYSDGEFREHASHKPEETLVMASCDPAAGLLAAEYARVSGFRLIVLPRSSQQALDLLRRGLIHVAGIHFASASQPGINEEVARKQLGSKFSLIRGARWQEGLALAGHSGIATVRSALSTSLRWVGREPGSGARQCLDEILGSERQPEHIAYDHRGVAQAIRCGWADAGVCLRLVSEEAGLRFLSIREEVYDLCFPTELELDRRVKVLVDVLRSRALRETFADLPGYAVDDMGELQNIV